MVQHIVAPFTLRDRDKCKRGHDLVWVSGGTKRYCRICQTERVRRRRADDPIYRAKHNAQVKAARDKNREHYNTLERTRRQGRAAWLKAYKAERGCLQCGESNPACLEFHHRDPAAKEIDVSLTVVKWRKERILGEIEKCNILCSNCHRKLHWSERSEPL